MSVDEPPIYEEVCVSSMFTLAHKSVYSLLLLRVGVVTGRAPDTKPVEEGTTGVRLISIISTSCKCQYQRYTGITCTNIMVYPGAMNQMSLKVCCQCDFRVSKCSH